MGFPAAVVERVLAAAAPEDGVRIVGLSGAQGSGKSTLAAQVAALARARGVPSLVLALDDFYLGRAQREALARDVHSLLATRGVPGTHDIARLRATLDALRACRPVPLPRFDKGRDDRDDDAPPPVLAPRLVLLEGWCVGVPPQDAAALIEPVNALEAEEDRDGRWRNHVNAALAGDYAAAWARLDALVLLQAPGFEVVAGWRDQAEAPLRAAGAPRAMHAAALVRFVQHYERLTRHASAVLPVRADLVLEQDAARHVIAIHARDDRARHPRAATGEPA
jgi:D-glycerate 3-kinase